MNKLSLRIKNNWLRDAERKLFFRIDSQLIKNPNSYKVTWVTSLTRMILVITAFCEKVTTLMSEKGIIMTHNTYFDGIFNGM